MAAILIDNNGSLRAISYIFVPAMLTGEFRSQDSSTSHLGSPGSASGGFQGYLYQMRLGNEYIEQEVAMLLPTSFDYFNMYVEGASTTNMPCGNCGT